MQLYYCTTLLLHYLPPHSGIGRGGGGSDARDRCLPPRRVRRLRPDTGGGWRRQERPRGRRQGSARRGRFLVRWNVRSHVAAGRQTRRPSTNPPFVLQTERPSTMPKRKAQSETSITHPNHASHAQTPTATYTSGALLACARTEAVLDYQTTRLLPRARPHIPTTPLNPLPTQPKSLRFLPPISN